MAEIMDILRGFEMCYKTDAHIFRLCQTYLPTHAFVMELEACGVTISTSNGPSAPVIDDRFGVLVEF